MILVDANLLIYAHNLTSPFHEPARRWLEGVFSASEPVGISWTSTLAFLRITTNPKAFTNSFTIEEATSIVEGWFMQPSVVLVQAGEKHLRILVQLLRESHVRGPLVMDAHQAALAIEHSATLCSTDSDFSIFPGLMYKNPLASS
ncbi:MAG: PIN domain-containing protein [Acidobacteria bacterium]|nr:PIN domain-containing protein [Acidobacteriota bacterium]